LWVQQLVVGTTQEVAFEKYSRESVSRQNSPKPAGYHKKISDFFFKPYQLQFSKDLYELYEL